MLSGAFESEYFDPASIQIYSNNAVDHNSTILDLDLDNYRIDILLDSVIVHKSIEIEGSVNFIKSITISDGQHNIYLDLILDKIQVLDNCSNIDKTAEVKEKISIFTTSTTSLIFYDEKMIRSMEPLNTSLTISTELERGIYQIEAYGI